MPRVNRFLLASSLLIAVFGWSISGQRGRATPLASGGPDNFGYTWDDTLAYSWVDATIGGTEVVFDDADDAYAGPISLGFDFAFYENSYNELYISTNGLLTFGEGTTIYENRPIPATTPPNDFIAPLWGDLLVGGENNSGQVFYQGGGSEGSRYLVIEWHAVTWSGSYEHLLTFEAILHESGDICFQYDDLNGPVEVTVVGIEDGNGVDGLEYLPDQPDSLANLVQSNALCFGRPAPAARAKVLPTYLSSFTGPRPIEFQLMIRNTGEMGADTYDLTAVSSDPDWKASLFAADGVSPLTDTDGDGIVDSGLVGQGNIATVTIAVEAPANASAGDFSQITLVARSSIDTAKSATAMLQSAVPAQFAQVYTDVTVIRDIYLQRIMPASQAAHAIVGDFTGSTMGLGSSPSGKYAVSWERSGPTGLIHYSDIEYLMLDGFGRAVQGPTRLTDNHLVIEDTYDHYPAVSVTPNGTTGVIWVRDRFDATGNQNSNIYFAMLDTSGHLYFGPFNFTANEDWRGQDDLDIPVFVTPRIVATQDNRFAMTWVDNRLQMAGEVTDIYHAVSDMDGNEVLTPTAFTHSVPGGVGYTEPALTDLNDNRYFIAYSVSDPVSIEYAVLGSNGAPIFGPTSISGADNGKADAVQSSAGNILLAWTNASAGVFAYVMLDGNSYALLNGPAALTTPDARAAENVSATRDGEGHVILTWMDSGWNDHLFYALLDNDGGIVTPPMIYRTGQASDPVVLTSSNGEGNAPLVPGFIYFPLVLR